MAGQPRKTKKLFVEIKTRFRKAADDFSALVPRQYAELQHSRESIETADDTCKAWYEMMWAICDAIERVDAVEAIIDVKIAEAERARLISAGKIECDGEVRTIDEWAAEMNVNPMLLKDRIAAGWDHERAIWYPMDEYERQRYQPLGCWPVVPAAESQAD